MDRLDRLGWRAGLAFELHGVHVGVRVNQPSALEEIKRRLPPGWRPSSSRVVDWLFSLVIGESQGRVKKFHLVYVGIRQRARTLDLDAAFETLESDIRQTVAAHAQGRVFVHAGVVGIGDCAVLLPGRSCSGKTTLVRELVRAGAVYYSDEFAVIDGRGRVHPFLKPLSIREGERIRKCSAEELGGTSGARPLTACAVVFTEHRPGARWRPARQSAAMGLLGLLGHAVPVRRRPKSTLAALEKLVSGAVIWKGARGEAAATARSLLSRVSVWGRGAEARAE
jgi:hypothetical protein